MSRVSRPWGTVFAIPLGLMAGCLGRLETRANPPSISERAPGFTLTSDSGQRVSLNAALAKGPVVLVFYRGHW